MSNSPNQGAGGLVDTPVLTGKGCGSVGGCGGGALSATGERSVIEFLLSYLVLAGVTLLLRLWDRRSRKADRFAESIR